MTLPPLLSILWGRRAVFAVPVVGALIGSGIGMAITPPQYQASARVVLNYIKPEPETGIFINSKMADSYEKSQISFLKEPEVAGLAAEAMGWLDSPELQEAYSLRDPRDTRDLRTWLAARVSRNISAGMVEESNILEIRYSAPTPEIASAVVGAIRDAYIQASTNQFRQSAGSQASGNATRLERTSRRIAELEAQRVRLERETGLILDARKRDMDAAKLSAMVSARPAKPVAEAPPSRREMVDATTLATLEATLQSGAQGLGPNHPQYQAMVRQRDQMRALANDLTGRGNEFGAFFENRERAQAAMFEALKAKVLSQRDETLQLKLLQDQIDQQREIAADLSENTAQQRQLTSGEQTGIVPMGEPSEGKESFRTNAWLVVSTAVGMGVLYGLLLAFLVECLARQVRTPDSLHVAARAPVIGVIPRSRHRTPRRSSRTRAKSFVWWSRAAPARA